MLELRGITAGYGDQVVLRNVDFIVPDRGVVALLGPNGAGKTTLLRVASGLLTPTDGQILVDGETATLWSADRMAAKGICHVPEGRGIFRGLTVRDNLRLQAPSERESQGIEVATSMFPRLGERLSQRAGTMSGGEQQMVALAHAYVGDPKFVLLDEVSMGLAPNIVQELFVHLRSLAAQSIGLVVVEQYVHFALEIADYVYVLKKGRVDFVGETRQLEKADLINQYLGG